MTLERDLEVYKRERKKAYKAAHDYDNLVKKTEAAIEAMDQAAEAANRQETD